MTLTYLTLEQAIDIHARTVEVSGGGTLGHLELGKLDSVLQNIQNDDYYPSFEEKLTHLFFSACKFHCFQDGNKRIAITLSAQMLLFNGYMYCASSFLREMENISYHVAAGNIDKELLLGACRTLVVDSENRPRRGRFLPISPPHGCSMGQEIGKKGAGAVDLQPTIPKSDRLLEIITAHLMEEEDDESLKLKILNAISGQTP